MKTLGEAPSVWNFYEDIRDYQSLRNSISLLRLKIKNSTRNLRTFASEGNRLKWESEVIEIQNERFLYHEQMKKLYSERFKEKIEESRTHLLLCFRYQCERNQEWNL